MRNQHQNENLAERFYIDLKDPNGVFVLELCLTLEPELFNKIFYFF